MRNIKLTLCYDGTDFHGWQRQPGLSTVQQAIEDSIHQLTGEEANVTASSRTDAGVHALGQVAHFLTATRHTTETIARALNAMLPREVRVLSAVEMPQAFHATLDARSKRYRYVIDNGPLADPFQLRYSWHVHPLLDVAAMNDAGKILLGRHDFHSFESDWPNRTTSVRTIRQLLRRARRRVCHDRGRGRRFPVQYGPVDRRDANACWRGQACAVVGRRRAGGS